MPGTRKKIFSIPIAVALMLLGIGYMFKVQHWPYGFEMYLTGLLSVGVLYGLRYGFKTKKSLKDTAKVIMILTWTLMMVLGLYKFNDLLYIGIVSLIAGTGWFISELIDLVKPEGRTDRLNTVLLIGVLMMVMSVIFKIQRFPLSSILQLFGIIISSVGFAVDYGMAIQRKVHNSK